MSNVLWILLAIIAYIGGLAVMLRMTPMLLARSFDEGLFMAIAAADILGAILSFGAVVAMYAVFNAAVLVKIVDFVLLVGILFVTGRLALFCLRPRFIAGTNRVSRVLAGAFCLCLTIASVYYMVQLFVA
jgi:hypothetical protein